MFDNFVIVLLIALAIFYLFLFRNENFASSSCNPGLGTCANCIDVYPDRFIQCPRECSTVTNTRDGKYKCVK